MHTRERRPLRAGDRLPSLTLPVAPAGEPRELRAHSRDAAVLLLLPGSEGDWQAYVDALAAAAPEIEQWYARIFVVLSGELDRARGLRAQLPGELTVLADPAGEAYRQLGIRPAGAALLIADRYGQLYEVIEAEAPADLPSIAAVEEWTKYLATQCPECGVIDEPGHGEWSLT